MVEFDYLRSYLVLAPLQLALIRSEEAWLMSQIILPEPILDIGCGDGIFGQVLFQGRVGAIKSGVDVNRKELAWARTNPVYQDVVQADARRLPFAEESFATVITNQSLEHIRGVEKALGEIHRVLKEDGRLVLLVPTPYLDEYWLTSALFNRIGLKSLGKLFHRWRNTIFAHHNLWLPEDWQKKLAGAGFVFENYQYLGSKKRYFISELLWPVRLVEIGLGKLMGKKRVFPGWLAIWVVKLVTNWEGKSVRVSPPRKRKKGPTVLMVARKAK